MQLEKKVKVTCFGNFEVVFTETDSVMQFRTKKAKELFAYFIHMQGQYVDRNTLIDKLWINQEEDYTIAALHNILYNLRKSLEPLDMRDAVECYRSKYRLRRGEIESDIDQILLMARAVEGKEIEELNQYQAILLNYKGIYMGGVEGEWHMEWAEYYEKIFINGCHMMAKENWRAGKTEEAIKYLKSGLDIDIYAEQLSALLIRCYGELRDFKNMKKQYEKYTKILRDDLGIECSEMLESAYTSVKSVRTKSKA